MPACLLSGDGACMCMQPEAAAAGYQERSVAAEADGLPTVSAGGSGRNSTAPLLTNEEAELGVMVAAEEEEE